MQQRNKQLGPKTEHTAESREYSENEDSENEHEDVDERMNYNDTAYANATPHDQYSYEGMTEYGWPLSPEPMSPSPVISNLFSSGYNPFSSIGTAGDNAGLHSQDGGHHISLTREEQENDTSYTMLASKRNANSVAGADGKIQEPHLNDVLCGRGGSINSHPGNRVFRGWIAQRKELYMLADSKSDKSKVTAEIFQQVRDQNPPGRFLHKIVEGRGNDPYGVSGWWIEIDNSKSLAKISQALREGAPAFRALHGANKKKPKKQPSSQRTSTHRKQKKKNADEVSSRDKRKAPPEMEMEVTPAETTQAEAPMSPLPVNTNRHELDVLFPTTNNIFATENGNGNGSLLNSYPLVHMGDYTASLGEVAQSIPTPPSAKKTRASVPATVARPSGKCSTPKLPSTLATPLVSPGFSPYADAKAAWDAIAFLPNLNPTTGNHSLHCDRPRLERVHSLSFSDGDVQSVGSFNNPFENDTSNSNHKKEPPTLPELDHPTNPSEDSSMFAPPLTASSHGLSFGRIGSVPGGNHLFRNNSRHRLRGRRDSSLSSRSLGSVGNGKNSKRNSIS